MVGKLKYSLLLLLSLLMLNSFAAKRYWLGASTAWNSTSNWSLTSGGTSGAAVPASTDSVYFNSGGNHKCVINATVSIKRLEITSGFTDSLKQGTFVITVGTSGMVLSGGVFAGGSANVTNQGIFTLSGCNFISTTAILFLQNTYTFSSGTFTHNNGSVKTSGTFTISGSTTFYDMELLAPSNITIDTTSTFNINHALRQTGGTLVFLSGGKLHVKGDLYQTNNYASGGGSATIVFDGTGTQYYYGNTAGLGWFCNITIDKPSGTLYLKDYMVMQGTWKYVQGSMDVTTYHSTLLFPTGATANKVIGKQTLQNLSLGASGGYGHNFTVNAGDTLTLNDTLALGGADLLTIAGYINLKGDIVDNSTSNAVGGGSAAGTIIMSGTGNQTIIGSSDVLIGKLCGITINKPSGTLYLKNYVNVAGDWKYTQGTIDGTTYPETVCFAYATGRTISGKHALYNVLFDGTNNSVNTITATDTLTVNGTFTTQGAALITINTGVIRAKGDIAVNNGGTTTGGTYTLLINGTGSQTLTGATTLLAGPLGSVKINKPSGTLTLKNYITVSGDWNYISGTVDASTYTSTVAFPYTSTGRSIAGNLSLYNVNINGNNATYASTNNIVSTDTLTVLGELKYAGAFMVNVNTGTINAKGNITVTNTSTAVNGGTGLINICGTGTQMLTGSGIASTGRFCNVNVNKPSGTLSLSNIFSIGAANWTYIQGTVNPGTSTFVYSGNGTINCGSGAAMSLHNFRVQLGTVTLASDLNIKNDITIDASRTLTAGAYTIKIGRNWDNSGTFTYGTGKVIFNGSGSQYFIHPTSGQTFYNVEVNKASGKVYLNTGPVVTINNSLLLTKGIIASSATKYVSLIDNATVSGGSDSSYVSGPLKKTGNDAFTFPLGDTVLTTGAYHPLGITAPSVTTDVFTGQYFATGQTYGSTLQTDSLESLSSCEYWLLTRNTGTSTIIPKVGWNSNSCNVYDVSDISIAGWNGSQWNKLGKGAVTYGTASGTIAALRGLSLSALPIAIGSPVVKNPTSDCVLKKKLDAGYYTLYNGLLKFKFDEEYVNNGNELEFKIYDKDRNVIISNTTASVSLYVVYKDNRWAMNIKTILPSIASGYYVLEVKDKKGEVSMLRFKI